MFLSIFARFSCPPEFKKALTDPCAIIHPFDLPVVPDVNIINARSSGSTSGSASGVFVLYAEN